MSAGFGISSPGTNQQNRNTNESVSYDEMLNENGEIVEITTVGKSMETTEEFIVPKGGTVGDLAIPGQVGTKVVTAVSVTEENNKYARYTVTTRHGGTAVGVQVTAGAVVVTGGTVTPQA